MEVAWCSDHGLPHSALLDWDDADRAKLAAHLLESGTRCQMCGTCDWEWEEDKTVYEAINKQCWGCYVKETAKEDNQGLPGSTITLMPAKQVEALKIRAAKV